MSLPSMKAYAWQYFTNNQNIQYYDIVNQYQTNPLEVIKSKIIIRLNTAKGEWPYDPDFGIPIASIKQNTSSPDVIGQLFADEIFKVENVNSVQLTSKTVDPALRLFTGSFKVGTIYGETNVEITV